MVFLRIAYVAPLDREGRTDDIDMVAWVPQRRLNGVRAARRGRRALVAGHLGEALRELDEAWSWRPSTRRRASG